MPNFLQGLGVFFFYFINSSLYKNFYIYCTPYEIERIEKIRKNSKELTRLKSRKPELNFVGKASLYSVPYSTIANLHTIFRVSLLDHGLLVYSLDAYYKITYVLLTIISHTEVVGVLAKRYVGSSQSCKRQMKIHTNPTKYHI